MPASWKKVIVSGSNASLNTLDVTTGIAVGKATRNATLDILGNTLITGSLTLSSSAATELNVIGNSIMTGSLTVTQPITGSLFGTASNAGTASTVNITVALGAGQYPIPYVLGSFGGTGSQQLYISGSGFSYEPQSNAINVTRLNGTASFATSASYALTASFVSIGNNISNNANNRILTATGGDTINGEANLTFDGSTLALTGDQTISGNLTVNGTTTTINTDNLLVEDRFILLASGSTTPTDGGIIIQSSFSGSTAQGQALFYDSGQSRWGYTGSLAFNASSAVPDAFAAIVIDLTSGSLDIPTYQKNGNIKVVTGGDIFIYSDDTA
jgi:hypothetical protein